MGMSDCSKVGNKETGKQDSDALYFGLVYNQNGSSSQVGRPRGKKVTLCAENR